MKFKTIILFMIAGVAATSHAIASTKATIPSISVRADKEEAIYTIDEKISFKISIKEENKLISGKKLSYTLKRDGNSLHRGTIISSSKPVILETSLNKPGFILCTVELQENDKKKLIGRGGAGVEPLKIKTGKKVPEDFYEFWREKITELKKMPMNPKFTSVPLPTKYQKKIELYDVQVNCLGGAPVSGYLAKPINAKAKSLPAYVVFDGAGVRDSAKPLGHACQGVLAFAINAHGLPNGLPRETYMGLRTGKLKGYPYFNMNDKNESYFLGMFLRVYRALQFIKAQPQWDGKTLIVSGGSQGGAQALVAAALDHQVTRCIAKIPALCDHSGVVEKRQSGWPRFYKCARTDIDGQKILHTSQYFDAANFALYIKCPTVLSVGFIDNVCSPASIYAAYNNLQCKKEIINDITYAHRVSKATTSKLWKKFLITIKE